MKNILVVNVNWLGDVIFSSPVFRALKKEYPQAKISCLAVPRVKDVLESISCIDEIFVYDEKGRHRNLLAKSQLIAHLRKKKFDIVFLLHRSLTRALLVFLAGIPQRVGYDTKGRGGFLTHKVKPLVGDVHRSDHYLNVIESFGIKVTDRSTEIAVSLDAQREVTEILKARGIEEDDPFIVINPGGNWDLKQWPPENFTELIKRIIEELNIKVVISGASKDIDLTNKIIDPLMNKPIVLTGQTDLKQAMALMKQSRLVISADSGPLHLANSLGTDIISIFGPTRPEITGPRGKGNKTILQEDVGCNQKACYHLKCPKNICMQAVTVEKVFDAIRQI
ncbi:ADP-heptose--lipooligosaccharide heptosyltransferase II [hydrothermal vent metagenome]|uniref:lipopolysaccharide heptosyltransferase II n=1 Tax=hydrothermal vent metagenome TaxID=652676 RepID=A0A3B1D8H2_9ZZZZ